MTLVRQPGSPACQRRSGCWATALRCRLVQGCPEGQGIPPCIPGRRSRNAPDRYDKRLYRRGRLIKIMFSRLKDWRCIASRYDQCRTVFSAAIALAVTAIFCL